MSLFQARYSDRTEQKGTSDAATSTNLRNTKHRESIGEIQSREEFAIPPPNNVPTMIVGSFARIIARYNWLNLLLLKVN